MDARAAVFAVLLAGCATDVTSDGTPDIDLDAAPLDETGVGGKADGTGQVVFLNYGGATIHGGNCSDAPSNCSSLVVGTQELAPFTLDEQWDRPKAVAAITRCVSMFFDDMNIRFVTTRPAQGPYTMMVIGAIYPTQLGFENSSGPYGRAPVDCGNRNKSDIGVLLLQDDINPDFYYMCRSIAHELGHSFGMVHTTGAEPVVGDRVDMMCESGECQDAAARGAAKWDVINRALPTEVEACDGSYKQNDYARMMEVLGVR